MTSQKHYLFNRLLYFSGEAGFQKMKQDLFRHGHELHYAVEQYFGDAASLQVSLKADGDKIVQNLIRSLSPVINDFQR